MSLTAAALALARLRHAALLEDDFEAFEASDAEMEQLVHSLSADAAADLEDDEVAELNELLALETASLRLLDTMSGTVSERLAVLAAKRRTNSAYLREQRASVNPV